MSDPQNNMDPAAIRSALWARLEGARGRDYWRSLDDLAATPEFQDLLEREFPRQAVGWSDDEDPVEGRRNFLKLMGASLALAGLTACTRQPTEHIMPYVRQPEDLIPGRPLFFATATTLNGVANGVLAESHEGRPTKMEGNPEHPATLGACDAFSQAVGAAALRSRPFAGAQLQRRDQLLGRVHRARCATRWRSRRRKNGAGIRILTETVTSPTHGGAAARPSRSCIRPPSGISGSPRGRTARAPRPLQAFGQPVNTYYDFTQRERGGFAGCRFPGVRSRPACATRASSPGAAACDEPSDTMNRLYVVEPMPTPTGTKADHRLALRASDIEEFAWALAVSLGIAQGPKTGENHDIYKWLGPIARDLRIEQGRERRDRRRAAAAHRSRARAPS